MLAWQKAGLVRPLLWTPNCGWRWSDPATGKERSSIGMDLFCRATDGTARLYYTITRGEQKIPVDYKVDLTTTGTPWGALRWWFRCPLTKNGKPCGRRVQKLYIISGCNWYGCRHCLNLTYTSCQESGKYDAVIRAIGWTKGIKQLEKYLKD